MTGHWEGLFDGGKHTSFWVTPARRRKTNVTIMAETLRIRNSFYWKFSEVDLIGAEKFPRDVHDISEKI